MKGRKVGGGGGEEGGNRRNKGKSFIVERRKVHFSFFRKKEPFVETNISAFLLLSSFSLFPSPLIQKQNKNVSPRTISRVISIVPTVPSRSGRIVDISTGARNGEEGGRREGGGGGGTGAGAGKKTYRYTCICVCDNVRIRMCVCVYGRMYQRHANRREQHVRMVRRSSRDCAWRSVAALVLPLRRPTPRRSHPTTSPATIAHRRGPSWSSLTRMVHPQTLRNLPSSSARFSLFPSLRIVSSSPPPLSVSLSFPFRFSSFPFSLSLSSIRRSRLPRLVLVLVPLLGCLVFLIIVLN